MAGSDANGGGSAGYDTVREGQTGRGAAHGITVRGRSAAGREVDGNRGADHQTGGQVAGNGQRRGHDDYGEGLRGRVALIVCGYDEEAEGASFRRSSGYGSVGEEKQAVREAARAETECEGPVAAGADGSGIRNAHGAI